MALALLPLFYVGCKEDETPAPQEPEEVIEKEDLQVSISADTLTFSKAGGSATLTVKTNGEKIETASSEKWASIKSGSNGKYTVTVDESDVYTERTARITFNIDSSEHKVVVVQEQQDLLVFGDEAGKDLMDRTGYTCGGVGTGLTSFAVNLATREANSSANALLSAIVFALNSTIGFMEIR